MSCARRFSCLPSLLSTLPFFLIAFPSLGQCVVDEPVGCDAMYGYSALHLPGQVELSQQDFALVIYADLVRAESSTFPPARCQTVVPLLGLLRQPRLWYP